MDRVSHIQDAGRDLVVWSSLVSLAIETGWMGHVERRDHVKKKGPKEEHKKQSQRSCCVAKRRLSMGPV